MTYGFGHRDVKRIGAAVRAHEGDTAMDRAGAVDALRVTPKYRIPCKVTASAEDGTSKKFTYTVTQVRKTAASWAGWTVVTADDGGLVDATAYNLKETVNLGTAGSTYAMGVAHDNLTGTFALKPVQVNTLVECWFEFYYDTAGELQRELWFDSPNDFDGEC